ncbi:hypothetical protein CHS0354_012406 [Potamilus streckersoni]|uniref:Uncharacterized protein n=1 Tax=Potamilus streckersoni TaxID=2493646 RepID=A0AAE0RYX8_9BIVA|nr:hypothetical protein CHS0354_012406 [Potamilus streckersoni]
MKLAIAILLLSIVAATFAQFACVTDDDCAHHCHQHTECKDGVCHCHHAPVNVGRRQPCADHDSCTCADGTSGHCDHAGVCHCHH